MRQNWVVATETKLPQSLKYLLSGPLQKKSMATSGWIPSNFITNIDNSFHQSKICLKINLLMLSPTASLYTWNENQLLPRPHRLSMANTAWLSDLFWPSSFHLPFHTLFLFFRQAKLVPASGSLYWLFLLTKSPSSRSHMAGSSSWFKYWLKHCLPREALRDLLSNIVPCLPSHVLVLCYMCWLLFF